MVMDMGNTHMTKSVKFEVINCENFVMGLNIETHGNSYGKTKSREIHKRPCRAPKNRMRNLSWLNHGAKTSKFIFLTCEMYRTTRCCIECSTEDTV